MKQFFLILLCAFYSVSAIDCSAQGITKNGQSTTNSSSFVNQNGKIGSTMALNQNGQILTLTIGMPTCTTTDITVSSSSVSSGGNAASNGSQITARGVCWDTSPSPTIANSKTIDGSGAGTFTSTLTGLTSGVTYYVRAYVSNADGTVYGNEVNFILAPMVISTANVYPTGATTAISGGNITGGDGGLAVITARGVCWNTSTGPTIANSKTTDGSGTGTYSSSMTGLTSGATYYVRAYATTNSGTTYGNEVMVNQQWVYFPCGNTLTIAHKPSGNVAPETKTVTYGTVQSSISGASKCWITQNLGSSRQGTSTLDNTDASAGWYWQFNRKQGYAYASDAKVTSPTWTITTITENGDWLPANDPCTLELGIGWRIPTNTEWNTVYNSGVTTITAGFNSVLKLHAGGSLDNYGTLNVRGTDANFWSSTSFSNSGDRILLYGGGNMWYSPKASGFTLRCLKD